MAALEVEEVWKDLDDPSGGGMGWQGHAQRSEQAKHKDEAAHGFRNSWRGPGRQRDSQLGVKVEG
jgi:hypothetical protein